MPKRCSWCNTEDELYTTYHDKEWGIPVYDDNKLFEMLILEGFQAGLSWATILHKRKAFQKAFAYFDPKKVSLFSQEQLSQIALNPAIIRNRLKIEGTINNAKIFLDIQKEFGSFCKYIWGFTDGKVIKMDSSLTHSQLSDTISKDLKKRGMKFVGSVIIQAYLSSIGIISAHQPDCFCQTYLSEAISSAINSNLKKTSPPISR